MKRNCNSGPIRSREKRLQNDLNLVTKNCLLLLALLLHPLESGVSFLVRSWRSKATLMQSWIIFIKKRKFSQMKFVILLTVNQKILIKLAQRNQYWIN